MSDVGLPGSAGVPGGQDDPERFGTQAFYAALGRAFVVMCAVVPVLALIELLTSDSTVRTTPWRASGRATRASPESCSPVRTRWLLPPARQQRAAHPARHRTGVGRQAVRRGEHGHHGRQRPRGRLLTPPNYLVLGASGVIFGWLGFLFMRALVERSWWNFAVSVVVGLLYGWQLVALLPSNERVSWQGHLFGFLGGAFAAIFVRRRRTLVAPQGGSGTPRVPEPDRP
jgi:hypothetical protein